jgi:hypothetical protein
VPGGMTGIVRLKRGWSDTLTAPGYVYQPAASPGTSAWVYGFMFWDVDATVITSNAAQFYVPTTGGDFNATAWYERTCAAGSSCSGGGGTPAVSTWAFSLTHDKVIPGTPITSVTPGSAWTSPSQSVSTATTAASIDAFPYWVGAHGSNTPPSAAAPNYKGPALPSTVFALWQTYPFVGTTGPSGTCTRTATSSCPDLDQVVPQGGSPIAIAYYETYTNNVISSPCTLLHDCVPKP